MALEPVVEGSIKDRILCAIVDHDNRLPRAVISQHVACNDSILSIALDGLLKGAYLTLDGDRYSVTDEARRVQGLVPVHRPIQEPTARQAPEAPMATKKKDGKKCTFCEETKDPSEFYDSQARCKVCFNGVAKVGKLRKEGKAIPPELQRFAGGGGSAQKVAAAKAPPPSAPDKPIHVEPAADSSVCRIIPAGVIECRVMGSGKDAEAWVTQYGKTHIYGLTELQQLRDWASGVLKREMSA